MMEMPPLPEPKHFRLETTTRGALGYFDVPESMVIVKHDAFSSDELRAYGELCARMAREEAAKRSQAMREALASIAAQGSANPGSTSRVDCMAALAALALRES